MRKGIWTLIILAIVFSPMIVAAEQPQPVKQIKEDPVQAAYNEAAKDLGARLFHLTATIKLLESQLKEIAEENQRLKETMKTIKSEEKKEEKK